METTKLNLTKGAIVDLEQEAGRVLKTIKVASGWDFVGEGTDLDISAIMFNSAKAKVDQAYFGQLVGAAGAVVHTGDNRTGKGEGDDETINIDLTKLPTEITSIVLVLNNFSGGPLRVVKSAYARILDGETNQELVRYELKEFGNETAAFLGLIKRDGPGWTFKAIGEAGNSKTFDELIPRAIELLN